MIYKNILVVFVIFAALLFSQTATAQTDYSKVNVDDLTDAQIKTLIQRADALGYNDVQLEQMAQAQGMKPAEIEKLRVRVESIRSQGGTSGTTPGVKPVTTQNGRTYPADSLKAVVPAMAGVTKPVTK